VDARLADQPLRDPLRCAQLRIADRRLTIGFFDSS
jgi:hypothetical protein